ncbi:PREDICTED: unconventional myosin-XVIIIa-like [Acropora digitifera]|uniref:unconventional myosin-XVIIIa-like n=1 Tax=Acropora digitifera TaxID=70779 RepID=UPI00077ADBD2|nr:PREDICTED: unconventional myosin-XVIIIa-like [Acropora digitifera]
MTERTFMTPNMAQRCSRNWDETISKKKDKDKNVETKEERRERRKKEKEKHNKSDRRPHGELGNIVAGSDADDKSWPRFSFRKSDKRRYDIEHDCDNVNLSANEQLVRTDATGSCNSTSGSAYLISTNNANSSPQPGYEPMEEKESENEVSEDGRPVPRPRIKRKKSSSIEIKLQNRSRQTAPPSEEKISNGTTVSTLKTIHNNEFSAVDNHDSEPLKPPRILADKKGVVELKLINAGTQKDMKGEPVYLNQRNLESVDGVVKPANAEQSFADAPANFDGPKIVLPPRGMATSLSSVLSPTEKSLIETGVALKLPEVKPVDSAVARVLKLQRLSSGDFGFALRRATAPGNGKVLHFVEPVGGSGTAGLLPGDRLVEVNGINVENESREKIIDMIVLSGEDVVIKVIPVPELSELSVRSGVDGQTVQLDESNLKAGTLARSGSKRMKKKAKSEEEVNSQKAWLDAEKVWVVHKAGFSGGRVQKTKIVKEDSETALCKVKLDQGGEIITVEEENIEKANPPQYDRSEDLAALRYLNESSCLHTLRQRFGSNLIHSYAGPNLIVINPQQQLAIYSEKVIQMFRGCKQEDMPPHIFASVQTAYRNMLATRMDQSIVFMGLSGSGKTVNSKHVMHYLTSAACSHNSALTDQKLEAIYALLEAFGNVSTARNHNASRFTLLFSVDFDSAGLLTGASVQTFLLEKSKVVRQVEGESTFKIFHYLSAGCDSKLRSELQLDTKMNERNEFMLSFDPKESIDCRFESVASSPDPVVAVFDRAAQGATRGSTLDLRSEQKGLLWILDEESIFPGANDSSFLARLYVHHCNDKNAWVKQGSLKDTFYINHCQGSLPVLYNARGWLKVAREHATVKQAHPILAESSKDTILDAIRKTKVNFVRCILPVDTAGQMDSRDTELGNKTGEDLSSLNVPLVRTQLRSAEMLDAVRIHRQGFPEHMPFGEFRRRFDILAASQFRNKGPVLDEKKAVETLLENLELDQRSYRLGLSQIFFRAGTLAQLEDARDDKTTDTIVELQAFCRGFLARRKLKKLQVSYTAIRLARGEVDTLKLKLAKLDREKKELEEENEKLEQKVTELSSSLSEERETSSHASEILEGETMERMRLERQLQELQESLEDVKKRKDKLEVELHEARALSVSATRNVESLERYDGEGASEDEEEESFYRERYLQKSKEQEQLRKKLQSRAEEEIEELSNQKRTLERRLTEATAESDEILRQSSNMKKKSARVQAEMEDLKLLLEEEQSRNAELEKKQRRFDAESQRLKEELSHERALKEKLNREKDKFSTDNYRLEHELKETKEELDKAKKELDRIEGDMDDITKQGLHGGHVVGLKKNVRDLEQKVQDQEEELDEQAGQIQMLEQAKLRLEMAAEHGKHMVQKELESKEDELEQYRFNMQKKIKQLEDQLEDEYSEKTAAVKAKRETDRRLEELRDNYERGGAETERKLKRELKKTKALLKDAQAVIESQTQKIPKEKNQLKALKNQLEDAEFAAQSALKGKKKLEEDVADLQGQLDMLTKSKKELDEQAGQIQMLEQAKLRLEMAAEHGKHMVQKDLESKEDELEQYRFNMQKKIKQLEDQLEDEYSEKTAAVKAKRETDRRLEELRDNYERGGAETERKLKRELKKTKALLKDAQAVIESQTQKIPKEKNQLKALKNQLEDAEFAAQSALKGKKKLEEDVADLQGQLDMLTKSKKELESKYMTALKETTELQSKVEEDEDDIDTLTERNRQLVKQLTESQSTIRERDTTIQEMSSANENLESKVRQMSNRLSYLEESTVEKRQFEQMESKRRELATQLDLEGSFKKRQEVRFVQRNPYFSFLPLISFFDLRRRGNRLIRLQTARFLKCPLFKHDRLERQMRELREEMAATARQEEEHKKRRVETEREVETLESVVSNLKQELSIAKKRVSELQHALEDDMHYDSDGLSHEDDDDDIGLDLSDDDSEHDDDSKDNGSRPSEPRSYRSFEELEDEYDISDRLQLKLNDLTNTDGLPRAAASVDSDVFENTTSSVRTNTDDVQVSRKNDRRRSSGADDHDTNKDRRRRKSDEKRRKSLEKKRSFEKRLTDNSIH